jgi:8-oxo-dGTP diphosphatase
MGSSEREPAVGKGLPAGVVAVTVDVALLTVHQHRFSILLVLRSEPPWRGRWALPGSFVAEDEDLDAAARRTLEQETGIERLPDGVLLEQLRSYGGPRRDPRGRVISVAYVAFAANLPVPRAGRRVADARFVPVGDQPLPLAFDHARIVGDAVDRARSKIEYSTLATAFLPEPFSISELRAVYEEVWGLSLDHSNFRRKVLGVEGFLLPAGGARPSRPRGGRPGLLYRRGPCTQLWPPLRRGDPDTGAPVGP